MEHDFLKPYVCTQCGGKVNRNTLICEMCGTRFKDMSTPELIRLEVERPGVHVLQSEYVVDKCLSEHIGATEISRIVIERMSHALADAIAPYMDVKWEDVPWQNEIHVRGRIRVLDPKERFW